MQRYGPGKQHSGNSAAPSSLTWTEPRVHGRKFREKRWKQRVVSEFQSKEPLLSQVTMENCQRPLGRQVMIWIIPSVNLLGDLNYANNDF